MQPESDISYRDIWKLTDQHLWGEDLLAFSFEKVMSRAEDPVYGIVPFLN
jgi:hypothetical protein